jgi:hypothetical protein
VEVLAALLAHRQLREESVREESLAAADPSPEVEASDGRAPPRQQAEPARQQCPARDQAAPQVLEARENGALSRIEREAARGERGLGTGRDRRVARRAQPESSGRLRK